MKIPLCCVHISIIGGPETKCDKEATQGFTCPHHFIPIPLCDEHNTQMRTYCREKHLRKERNPKWDTPHGKCLLKILEKHFVKESYNESIREVGV